MNPDRPHPYAAWLIGGIVFMVASAVGGYWYLHSRAPVYPSNAEMYQTLITDNPDFATAQDSRARGNYADAVPQLERAAQLAQDPAQRAQIEFLQATAMGRTGDYLAAIPILKAVAADETLGMARLRAYAVQELGAMYYTYGDPKITAAVFSDAPYAPLRVKNNLGLSYRHLFEYAASIYPVARSELWVANWYANQLLNSKNATPSTLSAADVAAYTAQVKELFASADTDIAYLRTDPLQLNELKSTLLRRAVVLGKLNRYGDMSLGKAEDAFSAAQQVYAQNAGPGADGFLRYNEAIFLARMYGAPRSTDVQSLLAPIYQSTSAYSIVVNFLKTGRSNATGNKADIVLLASMDPKFKQLLLSLGWTAADFK